VNGSIQIRGQPEDFANAATVLIAEKGAALVRADAGSY
jgi:hypothetical protein